MLLLSSADLLFTFKLGYSKKYFWNNIRMSNGLEPDQNCHSVGPDWVQTACKAYQETTKVAASKERVKHTRIQKVLSKGVQL